MSLTAAALALTLVAHKAPTLSQTSVRQSGFGVISVGEAQRAIGAIFIIRLNPQPMMIVNYSGKGGDQVDLWSSEWAWIGPDALTLNIFAAAIKSADASPGAGRVQPANGRCEIQTPLDFNHIKKIQCQAEHPLGSIVIDFEGDASLATDGLDPAHK